MYTFWERWRLELRTMYPRPNPRQRIPPMTRIYGDFGPYGTRELEMARSTLVESVYRGTGEILSRVKMKCGILPTYNGTYRGCEPHPFTNVSFESQSCELMQQDSIPWLKPEDGRARNGEFSGNQIDRSSDDRDIFYEDSPPSYERSFDKRDSLNNGGRNNSEGRQGRPRSSEGGARMSRNSKEMDMFEENPSGKRSSGSHDDARDYRNRPSTSTEKPGTPPASAELSKSSMKITVSTSDQNRSVSEMVPDRESSSTETKPTSEQNQSVSEIVPDRTNLSNDTKPDRKRKREENILETMSEKSKKYKVKDSVEIVSSDDSDDCKIDEVESTFVCFKCDLCDFTSTKGGTVQTHLKNKMHYSASKYIGARRGKSIVPSRFVKSMVFRYHKAIYKSVIPICPNCHRIYPNIHMCRSHNQAAHNTESREYGLCDVKEVVVIDISPAPICGVCKEKFASISKLNSHATSAGHYFYRKPQDDETIVAFCQACRSGNKKFQSFYDAQAHVYERHSDCETRVRVSVVFIEKPGKTHVLLPRDLPDKGERLVDEISDTNIAHDKMEITKRKGELWKRNKQRRKKKEKQKLGMDRKML